MGHVNGRTAETDTHVKARHLAEQARQQAVKQLLETAQRIRNFRSADSFKIARDLENSAYTLNNPAFIPSEEPPKPIAQLFTLLIVSGLGFIIGTILIKRAYKK